MTTCLNAQFVYDTRHVLGRTENLVTADAAALLSRIVIDQSANLELGVASAAQLFDKRSSHAAGTDHESRFPLYAMLAGEDLVLFTKLVEETTQDAKAQQSAKCENRVDEDHRDRNLPQAKICKIQQEPEGEQDCRRRSRPPLGRP